MASSMSDDERHSISERAKSETILDVRKALIERYIFRDVAEKISNCLETRLKGGTYDGIDNARKFALEIDILLHDVSNDKHLRFFYDPQQAKSIIAMQNLSEDEKTRIRTEQNLNRERLANFGFHEIKILDGNIGYLDLRQFCHTDNAGETAVAAMNFLSNSDAIIIDLRENGGGEPEMGQLLSSYFLKGRTQLNYIQRGPERKIEQYWTFPHVPGKRLLGKNLYLLTSSLTASAAEGFTYALKCLGRGKTVGETTAGAAHPVDFQAFHDKFVLKLPTARALNPISGENWETVGIKPDVSTPAEGAFDTAYRIALENLINETKDKSRIAWLQLALDELKAKLTPVKVDEQLLQSYVGIYETCRVSLAEGSLHFESATSPKTRLIQLTEDLFAFEDTDSVRIRFIKDDDTDKMEIQFLYKQEQEISRKIQKSISLQFNVDSESQS
ncbi:MAG: S41 family peptidase [Candidatus Bathyarchaeota archaeon]|nr:MAG: S41 family peptidase [Candidatus Bathyarchaeota archaeon]